MDVDVKEMNSTWDITTISMPQNQAIQTYLMNTYEFFMGGQANSFVQTFALEEKRGNDPATNLDQSVFFVLENSKTTLLQSIDQL